MRRGPIAPASRHRADAGFTLLELLVTMAIAGALMAIATGGMRAYLLSQRELGTTTGIRSELRHAGELAVSEGRTYCLYFTSTTWTLYKSDCTVSSNKAEGPFSVDDVSITLQTISFVPPSPAVSGQTTSCPTANRCAYFYPRGTAMSGSLNVVRGSKTYTISVERLTGRVSMA